MDKIDFLGDVEVDSAVTTKYYLQFADHQMKDLIRESVKSIIIYGTKLSYLPLGQLQNENFLIYDNYEVRRSDVNHIIEEEIRKAARFHKQQLDTIYAFTEGAKKSLSDMRAANSSWIENFNKNAIPGKEECKKAFGVTGQMLYTIFCSLRRAIEQISFLLMHLSDEGMIPVIVDSDKWQGKLIMIVINELAATSHPLLSPGLGDIFPAMSNQVKEDIVHSSTYDMEARRVLCCYEEPEQCIILDDKDDEDSFQLAQMIARDAQLTRRNKVGINELIQQLNRRGTDKIKSAGHKDLQPEKDAIDEMKCFGLLEQLVDICGEEARTQEGTFTDDLSFMQMLKRGTQKAAKIQANMKAKEEKRVKAELEGKNKGKKYQQIEEKNSSKTQEKKDQHSKGSKVQLKQSANRETADKEEPVIRNKKLSLTEQYKLNLLPSDIMDQIELMCDEQIISSHISSKKVPSEERQKKVGKGAPIHKPISEYSKIAKKAGKKPEIFRDNEAQLRSGSDMFRFNIKEREDYKMPEFKKTASHRVKLESEDFLKLTRQDLRKIEKVAGMGQMSCKSDISSISKEFKLISEGKSHKLQIRNTIISATDRDRKCKFGKEVLEHLNKFSFMNDDDGGYQTMSKDMSQGVQEMTEEEIREGQQNKKKKNKRNKKKKQKKNEADKKQQGHSFQKSQNVESESKELSVPKILPSKRSSSEKTEEQKSLTNYLENLKVEEKDRQQCHPQENFLGKCKSRMEKWRKGQL